MQRAFRIEALSNGVDEVPYVIAKCGAGAGYDSIVDHPGDIPLLVPPDYMDVAQSSPGGRQYTSDSTGRRCEVTTVLGIDTGCRYEGYYSDYTCNYRIRFGMGSSQNSKESEEDRRFAAVKRAHQSLWRATQSAFDLLKKRPVRRTPEIYPADLFGDGVGGWDELDGRREDTDCE